MGSQVRAEYNCGLCPDLALYVSAGPRKARKYNIIRKCNLPIKAG